MSVNKLLWFVTSPDHAYTNVIPEDNKKTKITKREGVKPFFL